MRDYVPIIESFTDTDVETLALLMEAPEIATAWCGIGDRSSHERAALAQEISNRIAQLIPKLLFGVQWPAAYRGLISQTTNSGGLSEGEQTVVVPEFGTIIPFPDGEEPLPVISGRLSLRWDLSEMVSFIMELTYKHDRNQLKRSRDEVTQTAIYSFRDPNVLGLALFALARF